MPDLLEMVVREEEADSARSNKGTDGDRERWSLGKVVQRRRTSIIL